MVNFTYYGQSKMVLKQVYTKANQQIFINYGLDSIYTAKTVISLCVTNRQIFAYVATIYIT